MAIEKTEEPLLIDEMRSYLDNEACKLYPNLKICKCIKKKRDFYYELEYGELKFGCVLQNLNMVRVMFYFYDGFTDEDINFWHPRYIFRLLNESNKKYNHTLAIHKINDVIDDLPIKVLMWRYVDTLKKFKTDFKFVTKTNNKHRFDELAKKMEKRRPRNKQALKEFGEKLDEERNDG